MNVNGLLITTVLAGLIAPVYAASPYCIAVNGGFGHSGTSFVARNFTMPTANTCNPWTGYTKTATSVILTTSGTACMSDNAKVLTVSVSSADPLYVGPGKLVSDYIQVCPAGVTGCPLSGEDSGYFTGAAAAVTCTTTLLDLPATHD